MKSKTKVWLGIGVLATGAAAAAPAMTAPASALPAAALRRAQQPDVLPPGWILAQHAMPDAGGEAGEAALSPDLPPDFYVALSIALMRGHLLVGDQLVQAGQWDAALPHFLHPTEELYGGLADKLADYKMPPFDGALKALADVVKAKDKAAYAKAMQPVMAALDAGDAGVKAKTPDWPSFTVATAIMALKAATGEYGEAIVHGLIAKPVEYQDARGFIWQAERMIDSVSPDLERKNAKALAQVRGAFKELKKGWPSPQPPRRPVKSVDAVNNDVARTQRLAGPLM